MRAGLLGAKGRRVAHLSQRPVTHRATGTLSGPVGGGGNRLNLPVPAATPRTVTPARLATLTPVRDTFREMGWGTALLTCADSYLLRRDGLLPVLAWSTRFHASSMRATLQPRARAGDRDRASAGDSPSVTAAVVVAKLLVTLSREREGGVRALFSTE